MRWFYSLFFYMCLPLVLGRLWWRARKAPAYALRWRERFGFVCARTNGQPLIWVHAVSVGESLAALPLIEQLQRRYPNYDLLVTTTTPTGSERVISALGESVLHVYAPYDLPDCLHRFIRRLGPSLAIIMETELWPNTIAACRQHQIPVLLANGRLSEKSARGYKRFLWLVKPMLQAMSTITVQHADDAERFTSLGVDAKQLVVTGNIKFDLTLDEDVVALALANRLRWQGSKSRPILLAASTHQGEDTLLLEAFATLLQSHPDLLLVLVPRHPERFDRVAQEAAGGFRVQRHSKGGAIELQTQVLVGDTMGELMAFIGASDVVFMGGTWVNNGGHNFIEPAAWAKPIVSGPSLFNFSEVSRLLIDAGALEVVSSPAQLVAVVGGLLAAPEQAQAMGVAAKQVAEANRGALERLLSEVDSLLSE